MKIFNISTSLFIPIITLLISPQCLTACSCDIIPFEEAIGRADEIFVGKIVKAELFENHRLSDLYPDTEANKEWRFYFEVTKKWKGNLQAEMIVHNLGTSCDFGFDIYNSEYLVYAVYRESKSFWNRLGFQKNRKVDVETRLCSRTINNRFWEKGNWFKSDQLKLSQQFPAPIELAKNHLWYYYLWIGIIINLLFLFILRRRIFGH